MDSPVSEGATLTPRDLGVVLNDVNKIRIALGIGEGKLPELPKGIRRNAEQCVLARALSNGWEVMVEDGITLSHPYSFDKPFDWDKAERTLIQLGFNATHMYDSYTDDYYDDREVIEDHSLYIDLTHEMATLIEEFDSGLIPDLVKND